MVCFWGSGAKVHTHDLFGVRGGLLVVPTRLGHSKINCISAYVHMGVHTHLSSSPAQEYSLHARSANASFVPIRKKVLCQPALARQTKLHIASACVFSRLFYNTHTLMPPGGKALIKFQHTYVSVLHCCLDRQHHSQTSEFVSDTQVLTQAKVVCPLTKIRMLRLFYLARMLVFAPPLLRHLLSRASQYPNS